MFDFETNAWVQPDRFNSRAQGHEIVLDAPSDAPAEGRWTKPAPVKKPTPFTSILAGWAVVALVVAGAALQSVLLVGLAVLCATLAAVIHNAQSPDDCRITQADRLLIEDPDDRDVCLVGLTIVRDGLTVGNDKGVAWFADGMILYNGHRTSFALGGEDMLPRELWGAFDNLQGGSELGERCVPLRMAKGRAFVGFTPLGTTDLIDGAREMRFLKRLSAFRRRPPQSRVPRQWPPLEP